MAHIFPPYELYFSVIANYNLARHYFDAYVTYSMLDHNGHMNNTHYLDWFLDIYKTQNIKTVQVEYVRQSFLGNKLWLYGSKHGNLISLYGYHQDELRFYMQVRIEDLVNEN